MTYPLSLRYQRGYSYFFCDDHEYGRKIHRFTRKINVFQSYKIVVISSTHKC